MPSLADGCGAVWKSVLGEYGGYGRAIVRTNLEGASLMSRRAMAYLELPARLATCRQPQDFATVQMAFWQTCMSQYQESARTMMECIRECQDLSGVEESLSDPGAVKLKSTSQGAERDFITFPEPKPADRPAAHLSKDIRAA